MANRAREEWEKLKSGGKSSYTGGVKPSGNAARDSWNSLKTTMTRPSSALEKPVVDREEGDANGYMTEWQRKQELKRLRELYTVGDASAENKEILQKIRELSGVKPNLVQRAADTVSAGVKSSAAQTVNVGGAFLEGMEKLNDAAFDSQYDERIKAANNSIAYWTGVLNDAKSTDEEKARAEQQIEMNRSWLESVGGFKEMQTEDVSAAAEKVYQSADKLAQSAEKDVEKAQEGLGTVGKLLVEAGVGGTQLAGDIALGLATGGGATLPMVVRSFGGSAQEARQAGGTYGEQVAYGLGSAALGAAAESISNIASPLAKAFGAGFADDVVKGVAGKLNNSQAGRVVLSALSEGGEEAVESLIQPLLQRITYNEEAGYSAETVSDMVHDFLLGAVLGGAVGGVGEVSDSYAAKNIYGENAQELVDESLELNEKNRTALKANKRLAEGKTVSGATLNNLIKQNENLIRQQKNDEVEASEAAAVDNAVETMLDDEAEDAAKNAAVDMLMENAGVKAEDTARNVRARKAIVEPVAARDFSEEEARYIVEEGAKEFGNAASSVVNSYMRGQDPQMYMAQAKLAFNYGKTMSEEKGLPYALNSPALKGMEEAQARSLFNAGRMQAKSIPTTAVKGTGKAVLTGGIDYSALSPKQQVQVSALSAFAKASGYTIELFESRADKDGVYTDENGSFNERTGVIRIDINAGKNYKGDLSEYALVRTASHEITHSFKKNAAKEYDSLKTYVTGILTDKGTFDDLVDAKMAKLGLDYEAAVDEVVADGCEMMLRDTRFAEKLAKENRTLFEKIRDALKKFVQKIRKAFEGVEIEHEEARLLQDAENLQKLWDEALAKSVENVAAAETKNTTEDGGVKKSARVGAFTQEEIRKIQSIGRKSVNQFTAADIAATEAFAQRYWKELGVKSPFFRAWFGDWRESDTSPVQTAQVQGNLKGTQRNADTGWDIQVSGKVFNETRVHTDSYNVAARRYLPYINDIVKKAVLLDSYAVDTAKPKSQNSLLIHSLYAVVDIGNGREVLKLYVEEMNNPNETNTSKRAYQLQNIEKYRPTGKSSQITVSSISPATGNVITIADLFKYVKSLDSSFNPKPASKIVNADGTPKIMYHGSNAQFTVFDKSKAKSSGLYGKGFYFTDSASHAGTYGSRYEVYLDILNPLQDGATTITRSQVRSYLEAIAENEDYSIENYGTYDIDAVLNIVMGKDKSADAFKVIQDINATAVGDMVEAAELFNTVNGTNFDGIVVPTETIAFRPEQIKSATDNIGTFDGGNPDIRYSYRTSRIPSDKEVLANYTVKESDSNDIKERMAQYKANAEELRSLETLLVEQREQLRELSGNENKVARAALRDEISKTQARIKLSAEQLERKNSWRAVKTVLSREKEAVIAQVRAEDRAKLEAYRAQRNDTESRRKLRERISYRVKTLDKMLREPTDDKHIPEELRTAVFDFCEVFQDEVGVFSQKQLDRLNVAYAFLAKEQEGVDASWLHDEDIKDMLEILGKTMAGKRLSELNMQELQYVRNVADHMYFLVRDENEVFFNGRKVKMQTIATEAIKEAKENEKQGEYTFGAAGDAMAKFLTAGNLKPVYFFERTGSQLRDLFNGLLDGQSEYGRREQSAKAFVEQVKKDTNYSKWSKSKETLKLTNAAGQQIELTVQQAMSLLATYERELRQGLFHVTKGGFVYEDGLKTDVTVKGVKVPGVKKKVEAVAHPMTAEDMDAVRQWLGSVDSGTLDYMERMVEYLSTTMADYGNETSMQLHGYKKFGEGYYFPIRSSDDYLKKDPGKGGFDEQRWKHKGFTKTLTKSAKNPFVLMDFDKVWSNHVSQMLMYSTMAVPQESFVRVLNYKTPVDSDGLSASESMRSIIKQYYGNKACEYIDTLLSDINGGLMTDPRATPINRAVSLYKKNAVIGSLSTTIQQISSVVRATALIDPKYFKNANGFAGFKEALEHSGVAVIKQMGGFDITMGRTGAEWLMEETPDDLKGKAKALVQFGEKDTGYRDRWLSALPARMDELGFGVIWNAVKNEIAESGKYEVGSDAFFDAVTARFEEVIEKTQVYDSVLTRSENMRGKDGLVKIVTSFMAEPTVTANMMADAIWKLKKNGSDENKKYLMRVALALFLSVIANNFLKSIATAPRDKDEDQTIVEKWFEDFAGGTINDLIPTNYFPYLREVVPTITGFGVDATWFANAEDLLSAARNWIKDGEFSWDVGKDAANAFAATIGVPLKNLIRIPESIVNMFSKTANLEEFSWRGMRNAALEGILGGMFMPGVDDKMEEAFEADRKGNEKARKKALDEIRELFNDKVKQYRLEGRDEPVKKAKSSLKSSITAVLKPLYQAAKTQAEKNRIKSLALRVYVGGEQLYKGYNFEHYWGED